MEAVWFNFKGSNWIDHWVNFVCSLSLFWSFCLFGLFFVLTWVVRGSHLNGWSATEPRIDVLPGGLAVRMGPWAALPSPKKSPPEMHSRKHTCIKVGAVLLPISRSAIWTTLNQGKTDFQGRPIHAKNVWCCGEGYFGQKKLREKCVNRDIM